MKGYENFPAHWETMSIKRIFYCVSGNGFKIELQGKLQGDYPFCKVSDLNGEERDIKKAKFYVDVQTLRQERFNIVPECSILFAKIGEALKKNHRKINLVPCCIDNNCAALVVRNNNFSVKYGYYVMKCIDMACFDNGGTIPYVDMKQLMIYKIPVPPKDEQDQIAYFLDWKITAIDKLIAIRREELRNLADLRKALITREVTRGNWESVRLKNVVRVRSEKGTYRDKTDDKYIGLENIRGYSDKLIETDTEYDTSTQSICREGDLLFGKLRPYLAKVIIAPYDAFCTGELLVIGAFDGDMRYLRYVMLSHDFITEVDSSTYGAKMPRANSAFILNISIPIPPTTEQIRIANYLDRICAQIDSAITNFTQQIDTLKELKARLISDTVTGKIDVRNITVPEQENKS